MLYCKICCQPDTRPGVLFQNGICGACLYEIEKQKIDWTVRKQLLQSHADRAKNLAKVRDTYDCACGVSGGKDSTFIALYARDVLGLNCLLVNAVPDDITEVGRYNFLNLINLGFDCVSNYVNPEILKKLMKRDFFEYLHFRRATEYPMWSSVYRTAKEKNIPLIIQGENASNTLGTPGVDEDATTVYRTNSLSGGIASEYYSSLASGNNFLLYQFPDMEEWKRSGGKALWLGDYVKEYSQEHNARFSIERGIRVREESFDDTGRIHPWSCLDSDFHILSQCHKYYKYGFGFTTDEVCYDVRSGALTRQEGFDLIKRYDGKCARKYVQKFCDFIGITEQEHWQTVQKFIKYDPWGRWSEQTKGIL